MPLHINLEIESVKFTEECKKKKKMQTLLHNIGVQWLVGLFPRLRHFGKVSISMTTVAMELGRKTTTTQQQQQQKVLSLIMYSCNS